MTYLGLFGPLNQTPRVLLLLLTPETYGEGTDGRGEQGLNCGLDLPPTTRTPEPPVPQDLDREDPRKDEESISPRRTEPRR